MARNVEIKARIRSLDSLARRLDDEGLGPPIEIAQDDTFFRCDEGRLKLRAFADGKGELIFYRRADVSGPKESYYVISPVGDPDSMRRALGEAWGIAGRVRKLRKLYLIGRTRVHLDRVEGLGEFLELEVVLTEGEDSSSGHREALSLMARWGIPEADLIEGAYVDLLSRRTQ